jgi:hypothetical protein
MFRVEPFTIIYDFRPHPSQSPVDNPRPTESSGWARLNDAVGQASPKPA